MAFQIPNGADAAYPAQAVPMAADIDILVEGFERTGVISGCAVTTTAAANQSVTVASGAVEVHGLVILVAGGTQVLTAPDASNPRIDLVWINTSGATGITTGNPASSPVPPAVPADKVVLAFVYSPASGGATIGSTWIVDKRVILKRGIVTLQSTVAINSGAANTLTDILTYPMESGGKYEFRALVFFTTDASTTGSRWSVNASAPTTVIYSSRYTLTASTWTENMYNTAVQNPAAANATSVVAGGLAIVEGYIVASTDGNLAIQGAREVTTGTVTAQIGSSLAVDRVG